MHKYCVFLLALKVDLYSGIEKCSFIVLLCYNKEDPKVFESFFKI